MGLIDKIVQLFGSTDGEPEQRKSGEASRINPSESDLLLDTQHLEGMVDVDQRSKIIEEHYQVSPEDSRIIAEMLKQQMEGYDLRKHEAKREVRNETDLDRDFVEKIWWTERQSIQALNTISNKRDGSLENNYSWKTAEDDNVHPVCEAIAAEIDSRGSGVSASELVSIMRETAEKYSEEGGTPDRAEHLIPHHKCRSTILPVVGE